MLEIVGGIDREQLRIAIRHEAMAAALELAPHHPVIGELPVMDDGDVVIGIGPIRMGGADVDIRLGRHARVADAVGALELVQGVLVGDAGRIAQVLDELERVAHRQDLGALDILDIVGELLHVAVILNAIAEGIFGDIVLVDDMDAEPGETFLDLGAAALDFVMDVEALRHVFLLGHLEAHHIFVASRLAIDRVARGVGSTMLQRLEHLGHFLTDVPRSVSVDESGYPAHDLSLLSFPSGCEAITADSSDRYPNPTASRCGGNAPTRRACTRQRGGASRPASPT